MPVVSRCCLTSPMSRREGFARFSLLLDPSRPIAWIGMGKAWRGSLNPLRLRRLATMDQLRSGRLIAGIGQGWMEQEFQAAGSDALLAGSLAERGRRGRIERSP